MMDDGKIEDKMINVSGDSGDHSRHLARQRSQNVSQ